MPGLREGQWARYVVAENQNAGPGIDQIVLSTPAIEQSADGNGVWFQFAAHAKGKRLFAIAMLASSLDCLRTEGAEVTVHRYILFPAGQEPLEYASKRTGKALLPSFDFLKKLLPKALGESPDALFSEGRYLGHRIHRVETGEDAQLLPVSQARRLVLDTDVVIGTSRNFKDEEGIRSESEYHYTPLTAADYRTLIQNVGMNRFPVARDQLSYVIDKPVFFLLAERLDDLPDILYRSNFLGTLQFMDEPITIAVQQRTYAEAKTPWQAAERMVEQIRRELASDVRGLAQNLQKAGWDLGDAEILQGEFPVWEACPSAAWYEFEAGLPGYVYEGRHRPRQTSKFMKDVLDVEFPESVEACIKLDYTFFRGAARHFGRNWGTAIYGQAAPEAAGRMFPLAYDEGATYFWFWTSDHNHHVLFPEQKQLTRKFMEYVAAHPRADAPEELTARAKTAIALPWGYLCGENELMHGALWGSPNMKLDMDNGHGTTYQAVLKAAMQEARRLLLQDIRFDFLFLRENQQVQGYEEVYRVLENGKVIVE